MESLIELLGMYNVLNCLFPGVLFYSFCSESWKSYMSTDNQLAQIIVWYFVGMIIDRFGSLLVEKFLKGIKFIEFAEYNDYKKAEEKDGKKLNRLNQINNMYRGMVSLMLFLAASYAWDGSTVFISDNGDMVTFEVSTMIILWVIFFLFFLFSYRKQTEYIVKTVNYNNRTLEKPEVTTVEEHLEDKNA